MNEYGIKLNSKQQEYLNGLLNRRGYTYLVEGLDENLIKQSFVADYFVKTHNNFFKNADTFYDDFLILSNDIYKCKSLKGKLTLDKNSAKKSVENDKQEFADAYDNIKTILNTQIKAEDGGHKYRAQYLDNIEKDIENSDLLKPSLSDRNTEELANLIGNISNLQLRVLRKYFNAKSMKSGDKWLPEQLHSVFFKWVRSWHAKQKNEKDNRTEILALKNNSDILDIFISLKPKKTIPPYEDQNNRRPPKDLTLRLKPERLDKYLKNWDTVTQSVAGNYILPSIDKRITEQINIQKRLQDNKPQKIKGENQDTKERQILANTLHRILDRSIVLDPYKLRWLAQDSNSEKAKAAKELLNNHSNNQADNIVKLAKKYYAEVDIAKQGLWVDSENSLFFKCGTNPPHKGNIQHRLVRHILREDFELNPETKKSEKLEQFKEECWNKKIKGNSTTKSLAGRIEETRKEYGNAFNYIATTIQKRRYVLESKADEITQEKKDRWNKYAQDHEDIISAIENADLVATEINDFFKHDKKEKYNNPYSIAQLYNHLESEISGFSKTDKWNTEENAWRDREQKIETLNKSGEIVSRTASNASRLTADSIRPFDGMLDRIISRQAYEIAQMKIKQIESLNIDKNDQLFVPIFMEQNRFSFEQSLHEIKGLNNIKKKTKERVEKGLKKQETQWQDKDSRIKKNTYCPYTDKQIKVGELDHIIPQSDSKKSGDVVFNSEANLIYCSRDGNDAKDNKRYTFDQLKPNYLKEIFNNHNKEQIQQNIKDFINGLDENDPISFHNLEDKEQNYLRHALFIPELDSKTFPILNTRYKTLVNGTQGYLGKQIRKLLQKKYPNVEVKTYQIPAYEVSQLRDVLGAFNHDFAKNKGKQGAFSHVIDAALVLPTALQNNKIAEELKTTNTKELFKDYESKLEQGQWLNDLLPAQSDVQHIERKPKYRKNLSSTKIFKEGLYGERFMPILLNDGKLYYGFSLVNCTEIESLKQPKNDSKDFDKKLKTAKQKQLTAHNKYYDLLKDFLYTGSSRRKNKRPVAGSLQDNQEKYSYLTIDKTKALNHLQKCAKEVCDVWAIEQAEKLEKLRYSVEKKKIKDVLLTGQSKKTFVKSLDNKKFTVADLTLPAKADWQRLIRHPIKDHSGNQTTLQDCFGKNEQVEVDNPELSGFWETLDKESGLGIDYLKDHLLKKNDKGEFSKQAGIIPKSVFNQKIKTDNTLAKLKDNELLNKRFGVNFKTKKDFIPSESWKQLFEEVFKTNKIKNESQHKQVRKDYSLPVVSAPSGGFRIKRKNPITNETVYQVSSIEGFSTKGYGENLKNPVFMDGLKNSPNIASLDGKQVEVDNTCYFDEWREIAIPEELQENLISLSYAIGSKDRFNIRVSINLDNLKKLDNTITYFSNISAEYKETDAWKFKKIKLFESDLLGKPRSNLFVEFVSGNKITFSYIVESTNKEMKEAYQKGTPIE